MNKIIFLDIDGVLNCQDTFIENYQERVLLNKYLDKSVENNVKISMCDIDYEKVMLVKYICDATGAKIVVTSSWRLLKNYIFIEEKLIQMGLSIIDVTDYIYNNRGDEIRDYLNNHKVDRFIILDDEVFPDFNDLVNYLVKTDFYNKGLDEVHVEEAIKILSLKNN